MQIQIEATHFKASTQLTDFIREKISHLESYHNGITRADIYLNLESQSKIKDKIVELKIYIKGSNLFVKKISSTFEEATLKCVHTMKYLLSKHSKKQKQIIKKKSYDL